MKRKDKRSMLLSLVLGDGCLFYIKRKNKLYGGLTIDHGLEQRDYQEWKAELISNLTDRKVKVRQGHKGKSVQLSVCMSQFKAWRKFTYPGGKKDVTKILPFIRHPEFALAVWLMDDGYVEPSYSKLKDGSKKNYGARFRLFSCATPLEHQDVIRDWLRDNFDVGTKVKIQKKKGYEDQPFLKFSQKDSLKIWKEIREFVLQFDSMKYKFRHIEDIYQKKMSQRTPSKC